MNPVDSKRHFLISLAIGVAAVAVADAPLPVLVVVAYAAVLGVAVDFDHFLVSRLYCGDWRAVRRCLDDPWIVLASQTEIFDDDDLWARQRLLSHVVLVGVIVPAAYVVASPFLAVVSAVVLYAHVLADLVQDNRNLDRHLRKAAQVVEREEREEAVPAR